MACEVLYKHRKPPLCHLPVVTHFQDCYPFQQSLRVTICALDLATPGSATETDMIALLDVISHSALISAAVCVEGVVLKGLEGQNTTIYGCGSPRFHRSVFLGKNSAQLASHFLWDKAHVTSDTMQVMGLTLLVRTRCTRTVTIHHLDPDSRRALEMTSLGFASASGSFYTTMLLVDLT